MSVQRPSKVIEVNVSTVTGIESWPFDDGTNDPWYANNNPYKWRVTFSISGTSHSSHITRVPYVWNGLDITVGDWIAGKNNPFACEIIEIEAKSTSSVTCIVEDVDRFNTFNDTTGNGIGIFSSGLAEVFELGDDGLPILNPLPSSVAANFVADLTSRFRIQNPNHRYRVDQVAHGFEIGEQLAINSTGYVKASLTEDKAVGFVTDIGPGPDVFFFKPNNKITKKHFPALPGNVGDYIYIDESSPGGLNTTASGAPLYLKLSDSIPSLVRGNVINPVSTPGSVMEINDVPVTFTGPDLTSIITDIDALTSSHGVDADVSFSETSTTGTISGPFTEVSSPVTFTLNGTLVTISSSASFPGWALLADIINDINILQGTHGITASDENGYLKLTNPSGGSITIVDVDPAVPTGGNRKSFTEATAVVDAPASTDQVITLSAADGREIILQDITGTGITDLGIVSVDNGKLPKGLILEQGVKKGEMYVVPDIAARDALIVKTGDMAFVLDTAEGEWGVYIYVSSSWTMLSNEDSSTTDAETVSVLINWNDPTSTFIHRVSDGSRVTMVSIEVITPFDGTSPTLTVGDATNNNRLMEDFLNDLSSAETFASTPSYQYNTGGPETELYAYFDGGGSLTGEARVTITYA